MDEDGRTCREKGRSRKYLIARSLYVSFSAVSPNLEDEKAEKLSSIVKSVPREWTTKSVLTILLSMLLLASILVRFLFAQTFGSFNKGVGFPLSSVLLLLLLVFTS